MFPIERVAEFAPPLRAASFADVDGDWLPLRQAWRRAGPERIFRPGWARIRWSPAAFWIETVFHGGDAANRATRLNEPTWELGDVVEVFLEESGDTRYLELHVTPENQRLQLFFGHGEIDRLRAGAATLDEWVVGDPEWVTTATVREPRWWAVSIRLPAERFGRGPLAAGRRFRGTVCRYDCGRAGETVHSATASLAAADFHRHDEWDDFVLVAPGWRERDRGSRGRCGGEGPVAV